MPPLGHPEFRILARMLCVALALGCLLGGGCAREIRDTDIKLIPIAMVKDRLDRQARGEESLILLIDARPAKYFEQAHLPGTRSITLDKVDPRSKIDSSIKKYDAIVVYGDNPASAEARGMVKRLMWVGYHGVRWYAGGIEEWRRRGYSVEGTDAEKPVAPATAPPVPPPAPASPEAPKPAGAASPS